MDPKTIKMRLQELAFLNSKATIWYKAASGKEASANGNGAVPAEDDGWEKLHYSGGLREYVQFLNQDNSPMHEPIFIREEVSRCARFCIMRSKLWSPSSPAPCQELCSAQIVCLPVCASVFYVMRLWSCLAYV